MKARTIIVAAMLCVFAACTKQEAKNTVHKVKEKVENVIEVAVPLGGKDDPQAREKERFDEGWRKLDVFRDVRFGSPQQAAKPKLNLVFVANGKETFKNLDPDAINAAPVVVPIKGDVAGPSVLKTQVYLDRLDFSVGVLDGRWGRNSAIALWWYQRSRGINATEPGAVDEQTFRSLAEASGGAPAVVTYTLNEDDVKGPFVDVPDDMYAKAELNCLCYGSKKEKLAERFHTTEDFLDLLNPDTQFSQLEPGNVIRVPNVRMPMAGNRPDIARVVVSIRGNTFNAFDAAGNLIFHAPTTVGSKYDPSPHETVQVREVIFDPHFHYQPTLFAEVPDEEPEAHLNPGPNSPVGVVWIALSKAHFGIHGTSDPDSIGYVSSHGCVRLSNWDANEVAHRIIPGVPIEFLDTRSGSAVAQATALRSRAAALPPHS